MQQSIPITICVKKITLTQTFVAISFSTRPLRSRRWVRSAWRFSLPAILCFINVFYARIRLLLRLTGATLYGQASLSGTDRTPLYKNNNMYLFMCTCFFCLF